MHKLFLGLAVAAGALFVIPGAQAMPHLSTSPALSSAAPATPGIESVQYRRHETWRQRQARRRAAMHRRSRY
jgi:hypothetical protein